MNDEILKLAKDCGIDMDTIITLPPKLETFYRAAYNKAIADAAKLCVKEDDCHEYFGSYCAWQIRELEMK